MSSSVRYWRIQFCLFYNFILCSLLLSSCGIVILQVQKNYGIAETRASLLNACLNASIVTAAFLFAAHVRRIGYKRSMLVALGAIAAVCALTPAQNSFLMVQGLFVVAGVSFVLIKTSIFASLGLVAKDERAHASLMNFLEASYALGGFAAYFLFSFFVGHGPIGAPNWLHVYYVLSIAALVGLVLLWSTPFDESAVHLEKETTKPLTEDFVAMFKLATTAVAGAFVASVFTYDVLEQSVMSWLPTFNNKVLHLSPALSIEMASVLAASAVFGRVVAGVAVRYVSWLTVLVVCLTVAAGLIVLALPLTARESIVEITRWSEAPLVAYLFPVVGMVIAPIYPVINSVTLSSLPPSQHAAMAGLIMIFSALGGTVGAVATGRIFQQYGGQTAFYSTLVPIAILLGCLLCLERLQKKSGALGRTVS